MSLAFLETALTEGVTINKDMIDSVLAKGGNLYNTATTRKEESGGDSASLSRQFNPIELMHFTDNIEQVSNTLDSKKVSDAAG